MPQQTPATIASLLEATAHVLLDGAMATELEKRGVDTSSALWSAVAMDTDPDAVTAVHRSYLDAGSRILITNSYQAPPDDFRTAGYDEAASIEMVRASARLALGAVIEWQADGGQEPVVVAGSIGPYGAHLADGSEYTGAYSLEPEAYKDFHRPRLTALHEVGITTLAVETQPRLDEVEAVLDLIADEFPGSSAMVSFSLSDATHLADGTDLATAAARVSQHPVAVAVGVNCVPQELVVEALTTLASETSLPLLAYPNSGEHYDPTTKTWSPGDHTNTLAAHAAEWRAAGARILGGCCRTTPADIAELAIRGW